MQFFKIFKFSAEITRARVLGHGNIMYENYDNISLIYDVSIAYDIIYFDLRIF